MSGHYPPLKLQEVRDGLKALGFRHATTSSSHEQWVKDTTRFGRPWRYKVTVDTHHAPFSQSLIDSMRKQAGVSKRDFYAACRS